MFFVLVILVVRSFSSGYLEWLDVMEKVSFNDLVLAFKCVNVLAPDNLGKYFVKRSEVHRRNI